MKLTKESYFLKENSNPIEYVTESINIHENKTIDVAILFTDMVGSSKLWKESTSEMIIAIEEQSKLVDKISKKYNGLVCKTIGDAFMVSFKKLEDSIQCGIEIQKSLKSNPIKITSKKDTELRIGICFGPVYESTVHIQNVNMKDYFGNTVNTASRVESGVSEAGEVAFAITSINADQINLDLLLKDYKVELISFTNKGDEVKRSNRTLSDLHRHIYKNIKELKGIDKIDVFKIKL